MLVAPCRQTCGHRVGMMYLLGEQEVLVCFCCRAVNTVGLQDKDKQSVLCTQGTDCLCCCWPRMPASWRSLGRLPPACLQRMNCPVTTCTTTSTAK